MRTENPQNGYDRNIDDIEQPIPTLGTGRHRPSEANLRVCIVLT